MAQRLRIPICVWLLVTGTVALAQEAAKPSGAKPANNAAAEKAPAPTTAPKAKGDDVRITFNFRYQPWQEVLDWFAEQAGLSLLLESPPPGTFNYRDSRSYTVPEALDVLNGVLLTKGYTLVRRDRMLVLVNLEDGVPPNLVPDVPLEQLDKRGEYELVRVIFPVWNMTPEQAAEEVQPILGPQGKVVTLPQARQIQVTETAGRLRTIRSIINAVEQPDQGKAGLREFPLKYITFEAALPTIRQMLGIPTDAYTTPDGTMQITKSATGEKILFRGTAQHAARLAEVLRLIDVPEAARGVNGAPQLEVYPLAGMDPEATVKVLKALLRDDPNVMLTADPQSGNLVAFATPPQQATIRATIEQMQKDSRQVDVITLSNVDPQVAVLAINKLFGGTGEQPDPKAPRVDADITTRSLLVRGTASQVEQIRNLLRKLGETEGEGGVAKSAQHVRLLPLTGASARSAIAQIEQIWPTVRPNRIRIIAPTATIPSFRPSESGGGSQHDERAAPANPPVGRSSMNEPDDATRQMWQMLLNRNSSPAERKAPAPPVVRGSPDPALPAMRTVRGSPDPARKASPPPPDHGAVLAPPSIFRYAAEAQPASPPTPDTRHPTPATRQPAPSPQPPAPSPIIIAPGPGGTLIASDDLKALDDLEQMLSAVAGRNAAGSREFAVFYLKYSKATTIAEVLSAIFGGKSNSSDKGLIGDLAQNALGDVGGALMGDLLLGGGNTSGGFTSAAIDIVPDARLNALIIHARPADLETVEQLLKVLDQRTGPDNVEADGQPRPIPVYNTSASAIAQIVSQVYQDRMATAGSAPTPQEMMRMLRGGGQNTEQQTQKMSIAVDTRNNLLIVRAPGPLFEEVKALVEDLDQSSGDSPQTTRVVSLRHTNSAAVQKALTSLLGNVTANTTSAATVTPETQRSEGESFEDRARAMRRNWEMLQEMRRMQERSGGEGGDRSRFFGRGFPGGGFEGSRSRGGDSERGRSRGGDRGPQSNER